MNKKTKTLTTGQYKEIIHTMREGFCGCRPNERIATALVLEGNLGLRISDILKLRLCDIVRDGDRYRLEIVEKKTGKSRIFTVPMVLYQYIENYCLRNGIRRTDVIFPITERAVQKQLAIVCDYLGYEGVSTHSFRKWYATEIYKANEYDIVLVQRLLQHSCPPASWRTILTATCISRPSPQTTTWCVPAARLPWLRICSGSCPRWSRLSGTVLQQSETDKIKSPAAGRGFLHAK